MRIIAFGDIHMAPQQCSSIPAINSADTLIATGDLTNYGKRSEAKQVLDHLLAVNPNLLALIGNLDNFEINEYLDQLSMNLHGQARLVNKKVCIFGAGGSNITPFGTPSEFSEAEIAATLQRAYTQGIDFMALASAQRQPNIPTLLVSHAPPHGTRVDRLRNGRHVGSHAVRSFIERHQPDVCITGHIHEARGEDLIGKTHIINPGMLQQGGWVEITLNHSTLHATLQ